MKILILLLITLFSSALAQPDCSTLEGYRSISKAMLQHHVEVLSADSLDGRATGTAGQWKAAHYIASVFKQYNLCPLGDSGTYFQQFLLEEKKDADTSYIVLHSKGHSKKYFFGKDFVVSNPISCSMAAPVVFVGDLSENLSLRIPDTLRNYIAIVIVQESILNRFSDFTSLTENVQRLAKGKVRAVVIFPPQDSELYKSYFTQTIKNKKQKFSFLATDSQFSLPVIYVTSSMAKEILRISKLSYENLERHFRSTSYPLSIDHLRLSLFQHSERTSIRTCNVVGFLPGNDSSKSMETIVFSAHHDHLGRINSTTYYPGADDNGSGSAILLELVQAFSKISHSLKRNILFISFTGEENGLLGSTYFVSNPPIPLSNIIAIFNIDMVGRKDNNHIMPNYIYIIGANRTSRRLDSLLQAANDRTIHFQLDYRYNDEQEPTRLFWRSDHSPFVQHGIPAIFFFGGFHRDYHSPFDTKDKLLYDKMVSLTQLLFCLGWSVQQIELPLLPELP
jgi:hypothetical protein